MNGMTVFLVMLAGGAALAWVILPLLYASNEEKLEDAERERLLILYEQVLRAVRELDDDYAMGKVPEGEYNIEREEWMARGVQLLELMGDKPEDVRVTAQANQQEQERPAAVPQDIDDAIEAAVARAMARSS